VPLLCEVNDVLDYSKAEGPGPRRAPAELVSELRMLIGDILGKAARLGRSDRLASTTMKERIEPELALALSR